MSDCGKGVFVKAIILAGGLVTRISEETETKPKPMVLLDDKPIIWHLMSIFALQGVGCMPSDATVHCSKCEWEDESVRQLE